jgi:ABC-2 type transport system permease protein
VVSVRSLVRILAFVRKELVDVLRQPRLLATLVVGPFLILLLFGAGYRDEAAPRRTLFVAEDDPQVTQQIEEHAQSLGPLLEYQGITADEGEARDRLRREEVDILVLIPPDLNMPQEGRQQGRIVVVHNQINPIQVGYLERFAQAYVDSLNRQVLRQVAERGQQDAAGSRDDVARARASAAALRSSLEAGDQARAQSQGNALDRDLSAFDLAVGATGGFLGVGELMGAGSRTASEGDVAQARRLEEDLARLEERLITFEQADPAVLVTPFVSETRALNEQQPSLTDYFAPAVVVVLLQHLAITIGALSIVKERRQGVMELFRVSPLAALELLLGKYLSFFIFAAVVALALSALVVYLLGVSIAGDPGLYVATLAGLVFASLGLGFFISLVSQTDSQAVQYTMIALLVSVFFSGFLVVLSAIIMPVRLVSWLVPATYGITLLQDIMLRGSFPRGELLAVLVAGGLGLFLLDWWLLRREMRVGR